MTKRLARGSSKKSNTSLAQKQNSTRLSQFVPSEKKDGIAPFQSKMSTKSKKVAVKKSSPKKKKVVNPAGCLTERKAESSTRGKEIKVSTKKKSKSPTKTPRSKKKSPSKKS